MSAYAERVEAYLEGLEAVSTGGCPGCHECGLDVVPCDDCSGTGFADGLTLGTGSDGEDCPACDGMGSRDYVDGDEVGEGPEPGFSWSPCEICGSSLGGDRHAFHALSSGELVHLDGCTDCVMYVANGEEPELPPWAAALVGSSGEFPAYAWPGGYPVVYLTDDGATLCAPCANRENGSEADPRGVPGSGWLLVAGNVHWQGEPEACDHCGDRVESAYGVPE